MTFAARRRLLMDRLRWAPTRGPKRKALLAELQALVCDELAREIRATHAKPPPEPPQHPPRPADLFDDPRPTSAPPPRLYGGRTPYWVER